MSIHMQPSVGCVYQSRNKIIFLYVYRHSELPNIPVLEHIIILRSSCIITSYNLVGDYQCFGEHPASIFRVRIIRGECGPVMQLYCGQSEPLKRYEINGIWVSRNGDREICNFLLRPE
jgi:hypothetical protein